MIPTWFRRSLPPVMAAWLVAATWLAAVHDHAHRGGSCRHGLDWRLHTSFRQAEQPGGRRPAGRHGCRHDHAAGQRHAPPASNPGSPGEPDSPGCVLCRFLAQAACTVAFVFDAAPRPLAARFPGLAAPRFPPSPALSLPLARGPPAAR